MARPNILTFKSSGADAIVQMVSNAEFTTIADKILDKFASSDGAGDLFTTAGSNGNYTSIGTHTDTRTENVGSSDTTITSNTITLYQDLFANNVGSVTDKPLTWDYSSGSIRKLTTSELNAFADDIINHMVNNEAAGSYRIANSSPAGTYGGTWVTTATFMNEVDKGNSSASFLYKKLTDSSTLACRPLRSTSDSGLQLMTDSQIDELAKAVRSRIIENNIGKYLLQVAVPTPGTWVNVGTITDTRRTTTAAGPSYVGPATYSGTAQQFTGPATYTGPATFFGPTAYNSGGTFFGPGQFTGTAQFTGAKAYVGLSGFSGTAQFSGLAAYSSLVAFTGAPAQFTGPATYTGPASFSGPAQFTGVAQYAGVATYIDENSPFFQPGQEFAGGPQFSGIANFAGTAQYGGTTQYTGAYQQTTLLPYLAPGTGPQGEPLFYVGPAPSYIGQFVGPAQFTGPAQYGSVAQYTAPTVIYYGPSSFIAPAQFTGPANYGGTALFTGVFPWAGTAQFTGPGGTYSGIRNFYGPAQFTGPATYTGPAIFYGPGQFTGPAQFTGPTGYSGGGTFFGPGAFAGQAGFAGVAQFSGPTSFTGVASYESGSGNLVGSALVTVTQTTLWRRIG